MSRKIGLIHLAMENRKEDNRYTNGKTAVSLERRTVHFPVEKLRYLSANSDSDWLFFC
jgi:hypothetical protein